jgi:hypothetical protein
MTDNEQARRTRQNLVALAILVIIVLAGTAVLAVHPQRGDHEVRNVGPSGLR